MAKSKTGPGSGINMQDLARVGAQARLDDSLRAEQEALLAAFPNLRASSSGQGPRARTGQQSRDTRASPAPRRHVAGAAQGRRRAHARVLGQATGREGRRRRRAGRVEWGQSQRAKARPAQVSGAFASGKCLVPSAICPTSPRADARTRPTAPLRQSQQSTRSDRSAWRGPGEPGGGTRARSSMLV